MHLNSTFYTFISDFVDEGQDAVLDQLQDAGASGVTVAAAYHAARDIFPHNPCRHVSFLEPGVCYFPVDRGLYRNLKLQPTVSDTISSTGKDPFAAVRAATGRRGMRFHAWVVYLHNANLSFSHPDCATQNVFGDPYKTQLCPANPDVQEYAVALTRDVLRYDVDCVVAEGLHYYPLVHGYHHERYLTRLGALPQLLLGLCFCAHCRRGATEAGVDVPAVARYCRDVLEKAFSGGPLPEVALERTALARLCGGELDAFLDVRAEAVAKLVEQIADVFPGGGGARFVYVDQAGAKKTSRLQALDRDGAPAAENAWQLGVSPRRLSRVADGFEALVYCKSPERARREVAAYRSMLPPDSELRCSLRPTVPDCENTENLAQKLTAIEAAGADGVDFYHYGLVPLASIDMVRKAFGKPRRKAG